MPKPEMIWRHVVISTHGNWLPGDPRGFRTRHHLEHVEGDYRNPPTPGIYDHRFDQTKLQNDPKGASAATQTIRRNPDFVPRRLAAIISDWKDPTNNAQHSVN